jgi:YYY domain-containing protein
MIHFFSWYLLVTFIGWLTFPLAWKLFPALGDRGYTLSRAAGLLIWGYAFWLLASLGLAQNDLSGLLLAFLILLSLSLWSLSHHAAEIRPWLKENAPLVLSGEVLFLAAFALLAFLRAGDPELYSAEKPMELAFINAILRSPTFPPRDPWLSGYAISYYHFGYVLTAMLARVSNVPGTIAHNLMTALIFGLSAIGAYGILFNLLSAQKHTFSLATPLLAPLFFLLVSNLEGFLEILHRAGLFWQFQPDGSATSPFWKWLDMKELSQPPAQPLGWLPDRYLWWWRASRVVQDYDLRGNPLEVIDEFPFFSFLHADLHPHVLALPFGLLAIAVALNLYLGASRGTLNLIGLKIHLAPRDFFFASLVLGGLAFLNTWDILIAAVLILSAYLLLRIRQAGWSEERLWEGIFLAIPLAVLSILLYLPFYVGFSSQLGGILPNLVTPTRGAHLWVMFAPLLLPLFAWFVFLHRAEHTPADWKSALLLTAGITIFLWVFSWLLAALVLLFSPEVAQNVLNSQGVSSIGELFGAATLRRLSYIGGLLTLLAVLAPALAFLLAAIKKQSDSIAAFEATPFVFVMIALAALLVITPDFVYLRDQFGYRINTVFKFYYQAWQLWSLAAAFAVARLLRHLRGIADVLFRAGLAILLFAALTYPLIGEWTKTNGFHPPFGWSLDDFARLQRENPDEAAAIEWLRSAPDGVLAEAVGGSYTQYARFSTYSGLPTVLGWPGHESQWRGGYTEQGSRQSDIELLYTTPDWETAYSILQKYNIRYVIVGGLERSTYPLQETKFIRYLRPVFQQGIVTIYAVW